MQFSQDSFPSPPLDSDIILVPLSSNAYLAGLRNWSKERAKNLTMKAHLMHHLSSVYFVNQLLHVSGIFVAHHQEVYYIYKTLARVVLFSWLSVGRLSNGQSTERNNKYQLLYIYSIPPDDGLRIFPKYVEVEWGNKLRINGASGWFLLHGCIEMQGQKKKTEEILIVKFWEVV